MLIVFGCGVLCVLHDLPCAAWVMRNLWCVNTVPLSDAWNDSALGPKILLNWCADFPGLMDVIVYAIKPVFWVLFQESFWVMRIPLI